MLASVLLNIALLVSADSPRISGVPPSLATLYVPIKSKTPESWKCLDGTQEILFSAINDDYCDCIDGSDEPATGACVNSTFYCINEGHLGATIPSSRVRDGLCEPECCDGSDELAGVCNNVCEVVGAEYAKIKAAENKTRKTGAKIRSTYLAFAQKEKKRLENLILSLQTEIDAQQKEVERLRVIKEHAESVSAVEMEFRKQSPLYESLQIHRNALKSFQRVHQKAKERDEILRGILNGLRDGYNPNYQDMAVLEAVRGWEALEGLPPKGSEEDNEGSGQHSKDPDSEEIAEGEWTEGQLEFQLPGLVDQDYLALLLSHESYLDTLDTPPSIKDLSSYLPEAWMPHYMSVRNEIIRVLQSVGLVHRSRSTSEHATTAIKEFDDAEEKLRSKRIEKEDLEADLADLFDPEVFGPQGEWKKLDNLCLEKDTGDYVYEVCLFEGATQKSRKGGAGNQSLGKFEHWNTAVEPTVDGYYTKQFYTKGAQCWNGPQRSVTLELKCGTENILNTVTEPEKCEYYITGETPALCHPLALESDTKSEL